jgi:hypothetical protein
MRINSEQRWGAYKKVVAESLDKALELFATKEIDATLHLDLNRGASRFDARSPPPNHQEELTEPPLIQCEVMQALSPISKKENDAYGDDENDIQLHDNNVEDFDMYYTQENMDLTH